MEEGGGGEKPQLGTPYFSGINQALTGLLFEFGRLCKISTNAHLCWIC